MKTLITEHAEKVGPLVGGTAQAFNGIYEAIKQIRDSERFV
jgi:hypothetical protein